ncbi:peptidase inhibitor family I36 protein [Streptomyces paludis]|uniref:peptidase inhibitor family I36 protein n=1 Tax=Streptomyces paludis TaxID=2282738 RepID=UPI0013B3D6BE|nr:peptidase inhibitor family I36 protein [Streptomyces paludis]
MSFRAKLAVLATSGLMAIGLVIAPTAQAQEAPAAPAPAAVTAVSLGAGEAIGFDTAAGEVGAQAYSDCASGWICFWSGTGGTGSRCQWNDALNPRAREQCSWMNNGTVTKSVYNRTSYRYHYYRAFSYQDRIGSTLSGGQGNLAGTYTIGSLCRHNASGCAN